MTDQEMRDEGAKVARAGATFTTKRLAIEHAQRLFPGQAASAYEAFALGYLAVPWPRPGQSWGEPQPYQRAIKAFLDRDEEILRELLGQWVSELEPTVFRRNSGLEIIGLGYAHRLVVPNPEASIGSPARRAGG